LKKRVIIGSTLAAILIVPFIGAATFVRSVWDPFGHVNQLPVAVVNQDKPVTYQGKLMAIGATMTKQLQQNHELGWHIVSAKQARDGLAHNLHFFTGDNNVL